MSGNDRLARLRSLSPEQHARLMAALKAKGAADTGGAPGIPRLAPGTAAPLSYAQERLAFLEQLSPGDPAYNIPRAMLLEGPLDVPALQTALRALVERHASLRTVFAAGPDGAPVQRATDAAAFALETEDLSHLPAEAREREARTRAAAEAARSFSLENGPVFRARLVRMEAERHLLTLVVHHAVSDGWSMGLLFRDLTALYAAARRGQDAALPELPLSYADFSAWQREWLGGGAMETQLAYWRKALEGAPAVLELPSERPRPATRSGRGGRVPFSLSAPLSAAVQGLAQREGATLYMVGLAAFHTLLSRLSGQDDVCVGSPIAGRTRPELEGVVGCFVNTLVMRGDVSGDPTFLQLLGRVKESTLAAYSHQDVPFERLVEELSPERSLGHTPLFQVMFAVQNNAGEERALDGVTVRPLAAIAPAAKFDLTLTLGERPDGIRGVLEFATDLFDEAAATRLATHFCTLLEAAATNPATPVSRLPLLTPVERRRALVDWNHTAREVPDERLLHRMIEAQAARTPHATAVVYEERTMTCAELDVRASQVAGFLAARGVGPGVRVGICMERGMEMVVAILGVLKAGGAYVPLEPSHPADRIAGVMADAAAPVLLTMSEIAARIAPAGVETVCLDADWARIEAEGACAVLLTPSATDAAYVIYTSGSTGTPKGVVVEHRQITGYVHSIMERLAAAPCTSFALVSTVAADLGHTVLFPALVTGGALHVVSEARATDPDAFAEYMDRHAVECMKIVPSHLQALQSGRRPFAVLPRKLLIVGGESSKGEWIDSLREAAPGLSILNHYGPTETTVGVLTAPIAALDSEGTDPAVHRRLAAQAARTPDEVAVACGAESLTFAQLDAEANRIAAWLRFRGVGPETRVALLLERGPEMVAAVVGVMKAGGAYVPLDPGYPAERLAFMLADSGAAILLTQETLAGRISAAGCTVLRLDADRDQLDAHDGSPVDGGAEAGNLAYVIYTSGSTGTPKGVGVTHGGLSNYLAWAVDAYGADDGAGAPVHSSLSFDLTVTSLFTPLLAGRTVTMVKGDGGADALGEALRAGADFSLVKLTPGHLDLLARQLAPEEMSGRARTFVVGGEALTAATVEPWRRLAPGTTIVNEYGPTETVVGCCVHRAGADVGAGGAIPIGRPIANTSVYVLDRNLEPVPVGVAGEIYIGGAGVARGYLGRPALTAEKFVPDPFTGGGARLYRTGDLARYRRDGVIEFLGRIDHQVKVRGFRVELGEIESALLRLPGVRETVVLAREDAPGDKRLVAYIVPAGVESVDPSALRTALLETLPEYMVPSAFVALEKLPLTRNGKVDRKALPAPDASAQPARVYEAPRTPTEEVLAGVWAQLLRREQVGRGDHFFELGGHSLLGTRVVSRIRQLFSCELPLRVLFEAPTLAGMAAQVDEAVRAGSTAAAVPPLVATTHGVAPLSFAQERLWILDQMEPGNVAYNVPAALRLTGALDVAALERALGEIVRRHHVLRSVFRAVDGRPVQQVMPHAPLSLPVEDLSALDAVARAAMVRRRAEEEDARPFDLAAVPPFRARLLRVAMDEHVLLLTVHHIVSDGWSRGVLFGELAALYGAFSRGAQSPLAEPAVQYADFAVWQRGWLAGEVLDAQLAWWKEQLRGAPTVLELPTDRPRPATQSYRGARLVQPLDGETMRGIEALGRQEGATPFMTLLAAWQLLMFRYSGQDDVVVGSPIAGRTRSETEPLIGCFVNSLALRADLSGDPTFRALLGRVRETTLGAYAHQDLPFERLVDEVAPERSLSFTPVFQTVFVLQNAVEGSTELPGLTLSGVEREIDTAKFDLTLTIGRMSGGGWGAALEYSTDLYDAATAARMLEHFGILLASIAADADAPVGALAMLSADERHHVTETVNARRVFTAEPCLHEIFAQQAAKTPDAIALTCAGESLTYRTLDEKSNQIARFLQKRGVGPEVRVGLCMERSMEMVVSILGVLKAGGAYVPLDPFYPAERLAFQVEDSGIPVLLTQSSVRDVLPENGAETVCLDQDWDRIAAESAEPVESGATPEALAYVIYTSGSTGKPKGVLVTHENAVRLFTATDEWFGFGADDVWTLFHSYAFDFSVWEIWGALLYGGKLVVVPFEVSRTPEAFYALLETEGVTVLNQTPSAFRQLMRVDEEAAARGQMRPLQLRNVVFGGEALDPASLRGWVSRRGVDAPRLVNMYGITETTVHVTYRVITREDVENGGGSPIGVAIPDLSVYVLDQKQQPVPVGVPGELYVGGAGVARGYHNRPELTAQRFIDSPFVDGERLYRSGDRVRWLADGGLEYLGRIDQQVKIRGFRIELGEIEAALQQHESVREAVVIAREDVPGDKRLVGYVVTAEGAEVGAPELRRHLQETLPDYMVPSALVFLSELPLTRNGKVDKRALPAPDTNRPETDEEYVAPRTATEETLAAVWAEVLRIERVGVEDNFFELGGDSILAIQVIARAQARGLRLTPKQIFQHQTVAGLASVAGTAVIAEAEQGIVTGPVRLTPVQTWFFGRGLADPHHYNQSMLLRVRDRVDAAAMEQAVAALMAHHDALRLRFRRTEDGGWTQENAGISTEIPFDVVDVSVLPEGDRAAAIEAVCAERQASLDLIHGPILRTVLFEGDAWEPQRLFITIHHTAVDGVSWRILLEDLETALGQITRGEAVALPAKTTSYRQWAERLAEYASSDALRAELAHWTGAEASAALPRDLDGAATTDTVKVLGLTFDEDETRALLQDVPAAYHTQINDVLLAALAQALTGWAGGRAVAVTLEGHGREDLFEGVDLSRTVGWFTSLFPVVLPAPHGGPGDHLKRVKELLRNVPNRGVGFGILRHLSPDAAVRQQLAALPAPEVAFNYLGQFDGTINDQAAFAPAPIRRGPDHAPTGRPAHLIEINGNVRNGRLVLGWSYSTAVHATETVQRLADAYAAALRGLIEHCLSPQAGGYTPSDFAAAGLSQEELDDLMAELSEI